MAACCCGRERSRLPGQLPKIMTKPAPASIQYWQADIKKRGFIVPSDEALVRCMSLCQSMDWSPDLFFDKLEAFLFTASSSSMDSNEDVSIAWSTLTDAKLTAFMTSARRQLEESIHVTPVKQAAVKSSPVVRQQIKALETEKILLTYNEHIDNNAVALTKPVDVSLTSGSCASSRKQQRPWIHHAPKEGASALDSHMENIASLFIGQDSDHITEWAHPGAFQPEAVATYGRLCSDTITEGAKWNEKSMLLESSRSLASGHRTRCLLSPDLATCSFFPGQVIAARGNVTLDGFSITQLPPFPSLGKALSPIQDLVSSPVISIIVVSGPYNDYLDVCLSQVSAQTHALILLGPFIDPENEKQFVTTDLPIGGSEALFLHYFLLKINSIIEKYPLLKIVIVPSTRDTFHDDSTLPQSPFPFSVPNPNIIMMPNPAAFAVNDIIIATTSADILFDMSAFEISRQKISEAPSDRMSRLCKHLLDQRHFYPLLPASPTSPMKNGFCTDGMTISIAPDIMILPSQHRYFVKNVDDVLCVNPGKAGRGTIARIVVHPLRGTAVEMVKEDPSRLVPHFVDGRCRVDILSVAQ